MPVLLENLSFSFVDSQPIFERLDAELGQGFTGIVGANGAGKSTLLALIAGSLSASGGRVRLPPDATLAHVTQDITQPGAAVARFCEASDGRAHKLRAALRLDAVDAERWPTLSPGERRRFQLAAALCEEPDVLLLDEPDAHLDQEARDLVLAALRRFRGVGVLVSHRRDVLDALTRSTLWLERGRAEAFALPYSAARAAREEARAARLSERAHLKSAVAKQARAHRERKAQHEAASAQISTGRRMKGPHDSDARGLLARGRAENAAKALGRAQAALGSRLERSRAELADVRVEKELGRELALKAGRAPERIVSLSASELRAGARRLLGRVSLVVTRTTRVRLAGPNGAGKSTLLRALARGLSEERGLYLPQWLDEETRASLRRELDELSAPERGRRLALLASLGTEPEAVLASRMPSAGEAKKLALVHALARDVSCLLLDEPTNDLDLPSVERLEAALAAYEGAIVLVTHDDALARATTREAWRIENELLLVE